MMPTMRSIPLLLAFLASAACAVTRPVPAPADPHFQRAPYVHDVIEVVVRPGKYLEIELSPGESDIKFGMGDREAWIVKAHDNILSLKPRAAMPDTNMKVWSGTSNRVYWFKLISAKKKTEVEAWHLSFDYPPDPPKPAPAAPTPDPLVVAAQLAEREHADIEHSLGGGAPVAAARPAVRDPVLNGNYGIIGPEELTPTSVFDNGEQTVMTFAPNNPMPEIFVKEEDGSESRVSHHVENEMLIVHRVARRFSLRHMGRVACLINGSFRPTGPINDTKTISSTVVRELRKGQNVSE